MKRISKIKRHNYCFGALIVILVVSMIVNVFLVHRYKIIDKVVARFVDTGMKQTSDFETSPYIGFVSFYRAVDYPEDVDILFLGDSMTERADMQWLFPEYKVVCQGIGGDTTEGMLNRLDCVVKCNPKVVVIQVGVNDIMQNIDADVTIANIQSIIMTLSNTLPESAIYIESVYPVTHRFEDSGEYPFITERIVALNQRIQQLSNESLGGNLHRCIFASFR